MTEAAMSFGEQAAVRRTGGPGARPRVDTLGYPVPPSGLRTGLAALLLLFAWTTSAEETLPAVESSSVGGGRLVAVTVPGALAGTAVACSAASCRGVLLLSEVAGQRRLFLYDPAGSGSVRALDVELPERADAVAVFDLDGDGRLDLLVGEPGRLHRLGTVGETLELLPPRVLVESRGFELRKLEAGGFFEPGRVVVPELGALRTFRTAPGGALEAASEEELPLRSEREPTGLRLYTPPVHKLVLEGRTLYAAGPEAHGDRRLRTVLIEPDSGAESASEAWSWLPEPESVVGSWYTALHGRPILVVTTVKADKIGLFEKKKLRVFSLKTGDRSRSGSRPSLKADTASHHWQEASPSFVDADGDGNVDLALVQPEGLGGKKLVVEVYLGRGTAQFHPVPLRTVVPAQRADVWHYGADVDGDGVADLVTRSDDLVQVFRGDVRAKKKSVLEKKPSCQIHLGEPDEAAPEDDDGEREGRNYPGRLEVRDVDRDGRFEILVRVRQDGKSTFSLIHLD